MSKIQDALKKLQKEAPAAPPRGARLRNGFSGGDQPSAIPIAQRKKVATEGPKHRVEQSALVEGGLLAPLDLAIHVADEFRRIKRPLLKNAVGKLAGESDHMNVIMVASAMSGAGKTFCSVNLAVSISLERELNVLLVDADVAKPHISRAFGLGEAPGLIDLLVDDDQGIEDLLVRTDLNEIQVLPAGKGHPQATELLASERMSKIVDELSKRYPDRIVLIDSPPLLMTSEAQALASQVGQIALVVEAGRTRQQELVQSVEVLDPDKAINVILNKSRHSSQSGYYGEYGYYGYEGYDSH